MTVPVRLTGFLATAADTEALGAALAHRIPGGWVFLEGDLGAGKTTLVRGWLRALGHAGAVRSPTFSLLEPYECDGRSVLHLDLYRLADPEELTLLGLEDWLEGEPTVLIEWAARGGPLLPAPDITIQLGYADGAAAEGGRTCEVRPGTEKGSRWLAGSEWWRALFA